MHTKSVRLNDAELESLARVFATYKKLDPTIKNISDMTRKILKQLDPEQENSCLTSVLRESA